VTPIRKPTAMRTSEGRTVTSTCGTGGRYRLAAGSLRLGAVVRAIRWALASTISAKFSVNWAQRSALSSRASASSPGASTMVHAGPSAAERRCGRRRR
jgi:hypothetical protein